MKLPSIFLAAAFVAVSFSSSSVLASNFPTEINRAAIEMAAACSSSTSDTVRALVTITQTSTGDVLYVLDGSQTPCGDAGTSLCGTGGCSLKLFQSRGDEVSTLYEEQVWSWRMSSNGAKMIAKVHPSYCGGAEKAKYCEVSIDTRSGKTRVKAFH